MPAVTVLLAASGSADAVAETARDLLGQTLADVEILVLAGPGTEVSTIDDARVRVVPAEGASLGDALNGGLRLASGEFVARAVPGDRSDPTRFARQTELLRAGEMAFVGTGWRLMGPDGVERVVSPPAGDAALRAAMAGGDAIGHPTAMMRRDAAVRVGGWRPAFAEREDYDLLLRLLDRHAGACTPEPMVEHVPADPAPGWRVLEQRILSEMAAMAAHDRRQAGRPDHGERAAAADRPLLHKMGLVDDEITRAMIARALGLAVTAGSMGRWRAMREAARLGLQQDGLSGAAKSQLMALWLRSLARRRPPEGGQAAAVQ